MKTYVSLNFESVQSSSIILIFIRRANRLRFDEERELSPLVSLSLSDDSTYGYVTPEAHNPRKTIEISNSTGSFVFALVKVKSSRTRTGKSSPSLAFPSDAESEEHPASSASNIRLLVSEKPLSSGEGDRAI